MTAAEILGPAFLIAALGAWEAVARLGLVSARFFPSFSVVLATFVQLTVSHALLLELGRTLGRMFAGFFLAALFMVPLGVLMGRLRPVHNLCDPLVELLRPLSAPAIIPVVMLFLGVGDGMKVFVVFYACAFPILINTMDGVRGVDPLLIHTARSYGAQRLATMRKVILPAAWPQIFSGFRISLPIALIVVITTELIGGNDGLGFFILNNMRTFHIRESYAGLLMVGVVGYALNRLVVWVYARFIEWGRRDDGR